MVGAVVEGMLIHDVWSLPPPNQRNKREKLAAVIHDLVSNLMYYNRKEDEDLPVHAIENMVEDGQVSIDEIVECFRYHLTQRMQDH